MAAIRARRVITPGGERPATVLIRDGLVAGLADYAAAPDGAVMASALRAVIAAGGNPYSHSRDALLGAIGTLLGAAAAAGTLRADIAPADVLASLSGVSLTAGEPAQRDQAGRLLDLLMDGLRYQPVSAEIPQHD